MKEDHNKKIVQVTEQLQASYPYGKPGFPCEICMDDINLFYESTVNWHWQTELEFSYIYEGSLELQVLEKRYRIDEGQGYLIMPTKLHTVKKINDINGLYFTIIFDSKMIYGDQTSILFQKYIEPIVKDSSIDVLIFNANVPWQMEVIEQLKKIQQLLVKEELCYEIYVHEEILKMWRIIYLNTYNKLMPSPKIHIRDEQRIMKFLHYINSNYERQITLDDIANSGNVSRSECCRFFKKTIHDTPFGYLIKYRINKSLELLRDNQNTITEIAFAVGFTNINYYTTTFKNQMGCSPRENRKKYLELLEKTKL